MAEDLKNASHYTVSDTINENITILTHITYALSLLSGGGFIAAIILYFTSRDTFSKSHLGFIIKTNVIFILVLIGLTILFSLFGMSNALRDSLPMFDSFSLIYLGTSPTFQIIWVSIVALGLTLWFFLRILSGWIAFFRKEPIQGHFGLQWSKK